MIFSFLDGPDSSPKREADQFPGPVWCHNGVLPKEAKYHTFLSPKISNYFDSEQGVLKTHRIKLQEFNSTCVFLHPEQAFQLITKMKSYLLEKRFLFFGELHDGYLEMTGPAYSQLINFIVPYMPKNIILFTERKIYIKDADFPIIPLDETGSYEISMSLSIFALESIFTPYDSVDASRLTKKAELRSLFLYNRHIWQQLSESKTLPPTVASLCTRILSYSTKDNSFADKVISLFQKSQMTAFKLIYEFIHLLIPKLKKLDDPIKVMRKNL